jgi:hypothetical protein
MHNRTSSSLQMKSPIVEFLTTVAKKDEKEYSENEIFNMSLANVINNASWSQSDILFSTPVWLRHIIEKKASSTPFDINPKQIIIDEFDELVNNPQLSEHLYKILDYFGSISEDNPNAKFTPEVNKHR